jgi:hypothetical protein
MMFTQRIYLEAKTGSQNFMPPIYGAQSTKENLIAALKGYSFNKIHLEPTE